MGVDGHSFFVGEALFDEFSSSLECRSQLLYCDDTIRTAGIEFSCRQHKRPKRNSPFAHSLYCVILGVS